MALTRVYVRRVGGLGTVEGGGMLIWVWGAWGRSVQVEMVRMLRAAGADVALTNANGYTPMQVPSPLRVLVC